MNTYRFRKRLLGVCLVIPLLLSGCSRGSIPGSVQIESSYASFSEFTKDLFVTEISGNTLNLHYTLADPAAYGIEKIPVTFGTISASSGDSTTMYIENYLSILHTFNYNNLTEQERITYDILEYELENSLEAASYTLYQEPLSPSLGTQAQLPVLLAEYTFYSAEDVHIYLQLLEQIDTYYQDILEFEIEKAREGLFMSDAIAGSVIDQCRDFIAEPENNILLLTFEERIHELDDIEAEDCDALIAENKKLVMEHVIPAYELLIEGLEKLKGTGTNEYGLCHYDNGSEYYEYLVKTYTGSGRSVQDIQKLLDARMDADMDIMVSLIESNPSVLASADTADMEENDPMNMLASLQDGIAADFPAAPEVEYTVKYVDESLQDYLSPAFYLTPPIDRITDNVIYINPASNYNGIQLFTTLAHEGYPGHLYQSVYGGEQTANPLRSVLYFGGYVEGWATYVEMYSYALSGLEADVYNLLQANSSINLCLYANMDIGIHYNGWTQEDLSDYLYSYGITDAATAAEIYQSLLTQPGNYLKYYAGYLEFLALKETAEAALGDSFVLKDFHQFILDIGPAPFSLLEQYLNDWLNITKKAA